jgi:hypothetical protein
MTKLLEKAVQAVSLLPPEDQDEIARAMLRLATAEDEPEEIPPEDLPAVLEGLAQAERGELASDEEVEVLISRFGP